MYAVAGAADSADARCPSKPARHGTRMSEISESARLTLVMADFAMVTGEGKVNIVGAGLSGLGFDPGQGVTTRFTVVSEVCIPAASAPAEAAVEITLLREGEVVKLAGPLGEQALRIGQTPTFEKPNFPAAMAVRDAVEARHVSVLDFGSGLPIAPNAAYEWVLQVDGDADNAIRYPFAVLAGTPGPVFG